MMTIIVMLILVGVTINVALNGELFTQAQTAANDTQIQADKEQLLSAVVGAIGTDAKVDFNKLDNNLPKDWTGSNGTYTSPNGNTFTVDEKGNITNEDKTEETTPGTGGETENDSANSYTFTIAEIMQKGMDETDTTRVIPIEEFWPDTVSEELKNNAFATITATSIPVCTNITCSDSRFNFPYNNYETGDVSAYAPWSISIALLSDSYVIINVLDGDREYVDIDNYIDSEFKDLEITMGLSK